MFVCMPCGKRTLGSRIMIPNRSHKGKNKSGQTILTDPVRFIGSEVPSQLVKHNWFGTSLNWFTMLTNSNHWTHISYALHCMQCCMRAYTVLKVDLWSLTHHCRLFNKITYCTKLIFHIGCAKITQSA